MNRLASWAWDEFEGVYWRGCGNCGTELPTDGAWGCNEDDETCCPSCGQVYEDESDQYGDEAIGHTYDKDGLCMGVDSDGDLWVYKSPLTIRASFCSPCAPGACSLGSPCDDGEECYAVPRDWFDANEGDPCPYPKPVDLYARVTEDGYMLYAATKTDYTGSDNYWPDYYSDEFSESALATICLVGVPASIAADLCEHGGSGQVFSDGYEAWQAAMPYETEGSAS